MLKLSSSKAHLGLAADGMALIKFTGRRGQAQVLAESALGSEHRDAPQALADAMRAMLKSPSCSGHDVSVVLADRWVRLFVVTPPQNTGSLEDCKAAATMRFHELYGENLASWELQADWNAKLPFLACAMPKSLLATLQQMADEFRWTLLSVAPHFVAAWNRWHRQLDGKAWFGVALGESLTMGAVEGGVLRAVSVTQLDDKLWQDEQWLPGHLAREALKLNLAQPQQLQMCGRIAGIPASRAEIARGCKRLDAGAALLDAADSSAMTLARTGLRA